MRSSSWRLPPAAVVQGNALSLPLPDESVDLVVTSPPYWSLRSYRDDGAHYEGQIGSEPTPQAFLEGLWAATREMWRVLKPTGSAFVQLGDKYAGSGGHNNASLVASGNKHAKAARSMMHDGDVVDPLAFATRRNAPDRYNQSTGGIRAKSLMLLPERYRIGCVDGQAAPNGQRWIARAVIIHSKLNGLPESVTDRVRRSHEDWVHLVKGPRYFAAVDEVREASAGRRQPGGPWLERNEGHVLGREEAPHCGLTNYEPNPLGKLPGSVWSLASEPLIVPEEVRRRLNLPDHFAAFGTEVVRRLILGWSPSGICVACGEGRRPVVEKAHARTQETYSREGKWRQEGIGPGNGYSRLGDPMRTEATITGYACACHCTHCVAGYCPTEYHDPTWKVPPTRPAVVLDPFGGSGTTALVARALGRIGISNDLSHDYSRLARWRIFESDAWHKAQDRTTDERQGTLL